jgi:hypothetical protein
LPNRRLNLTGLSKPQNTPLRLAAANARDAVKAMHAASSSYRHAIGEIGTIEAELREWTF